MSCGDSALIVSRWPGRRKPGVAVAAVTRRLHGYVVAPIDGGTALNGEPLGNEAVALQDGDVLELGGTRMQFVAN